MKSTTMARFIIILLLFYILSMVSGCKSNAEDDNQGLKENMLSYKIVNINEELKLVSISEICKSSKDEIAFYDEENAKILVIDRNNELIREISGDFRGTVHMDFGPEDNLYVIVESTRKNDSGDINGLIRKLMVYDSQGDRLDNKCFASEIDGNWETLKGSLARKIYVTGKEEIYMLKTGGTIEAYDIFLNKKGKWEAAQYRDMCLDEADNLILLYTKNTSSTVEKIDTRGNKTIYKREIARDDSPESIYTDRATGLTYGIRDGIIYRWDFAGKAKEKLLNCRDLWPIGDVYGLLVNSGEEVYILSSEGKEQTLIKYGKKAKAEEKTAVDVDKGIHITVWSDPGGMLSNSARAFENKYTDTKVIVESYDELEYEQYVQRINTELMAGKGPDLIYGYFPFHEYQEKGLLLNLDDMINNDPDFDMTDYDQTIINAYKSKDGFYVMPISYTVNCFLANSMLVQDKGIGFNDSWTWLDLYNMVKEANEKQGLKCYGIPKTPENYLFREVIYKDIDYYMERGEKLAKFDTKEFTDALKLLKKMMDEQIEHPDIDLRTVIRSDGEVAPDDILFIPIQLFSYDNIKAYSNYYKSIKLMPIPRGLYTDAKEFMGRDIAINKSSPNKNEAWLFIKFLISEEMQSKMSQNGFNVNLKARDKYIEQIFDNQNKYPNSNNYRITSEDIQRLQGIIKDCNKKYWGYTALKTSGKLISILIVITLFIYAAFNYHHASPKSISTTFPDEQL